MRLELPLANYTLMSDHIARVISRQIRWSYNYPDKADSFVSTHAMLRPQPVYITQQL